MSAADEEDRVVLRLNALPDDIDIDGNEGDYAVVVPRSVREAVTPDQRTEALRNLQSNRQARSVRGGPPPPLPERVYSPSFVRSVCSPPRLQSQQLRSLAESSEDLKARLSREHRTASKLIIDARKLDDETTVDDEDAFADFASLMAPAAAPTDTVPTMRTISYSESIESSSTRGSRSNSIPGVLELHGNTAG